MSLAPGSQFRITSPRGGAPFARPGVLDPGMARGLKFLHIPGIYRNLSPFTRRFAPQDTFSNTTCPLVATPWGRGWQINGTSQYIALASNTQASIFATFVYVLSGLNRLAEGEMCPIFVHLGSESNSYMRVRMISGVPTFVASNSSGEVIGGPVQDGPIVVRCTGAAPTPIEVYQRGALVWSGSYIGGSVPQVSMVGTWTVAGKGDIVLSAIFSGGLKPALCQELSLNPWKMFSLG